MTVSGELKKKLECLEQDVPIICPPVNVQAAELERTWQRESRAQMQAARDGFRGLRSGFAKLD